MWTESTQKTVLIEVTTTHFEEGDLVSFDVASDDIYATSDITVYYPSPTTPLQITRPRFCKEV